jgi:hypothetical protein
MNQPMKRQPKKRVPPKTNPNGPVVAEQQTVDQRQIDKNNGKMAVPRHSGTRIGKEVDFVETVGLGTLRVVTANGVKD